MCVKIKVYKLFIKTFSRPEFGRNLDFDYFRFFLRISVEIDLQKIAQRATSGRTIHIGAGGDGGFLTSVLAWKSWDF